MNLEDVLTEIIFLKHSIPSTTERATDELKQTKILYEEIRRIETRLNSYKNVLDTKVRKLKLILDKKDLEFPIYEECNARILRITNLTEEFIYLKYDSQLTPMEFSIFTGKRTDGKSEFVIDRRKCLRIWENYLTTSLGKNYDTE